MHSRWANKNNEDSMKEKTEYFKALAKVKIDRSSATADHTKTTGLIDHIDIAVCVLLNVTDFHIIPF